MSATAVASPSPTHIWNPWEDLPWWQRGKYPVVPPPPGITANLVDPDSKVKWGILTQSVCITIATIVIILRMYTKISILRVPGWEDWTALAGYFGFLGLVSVIIALDHHGNGKHRWDITGDSYTTYLRLTYINEVIYGPIMCTIKISILLLYLRIFQPVRGTFIAFHLILWANVALYGAGVFTEIFQCAPIRKIWYPLWPGSCIDQKAVQLASAGFNLVSDFAILVLPIIAVWNLNTTRDRKLGLIIIFGFGIGGCIASCVRLIVVTENKWAGDTTWTLYGLNLLTLAELTCGILCSCLPAIPAFFRSLPRVHINVHFSSGKTLSRSPTLVLIPLNQARISGSGGSGGGTMRTNTLSSPTLGGRSPRSGMGGGKGGAWDEIDEVEDVWKEDIEVGLPCKPDYKGSVGAGGGGGHNEYVDRGMWARDKGERDQQWGRYDREMGPKRETGRRREGQRVVGERGGGGEEWMRPRYAIEDEMGGRGGGRGRGGGDRGGGDRGVGDRGEGVEGTVIR